MPVKSSGAAALRSGETRGPKGRAGDIEAPILSTEALDDRIAIVGTAGSGKTYAAKDFVERLLARLAPASRLSIRLACGGGCVPAPTAVLPAIRLSCSAAAMPTSRSLPRWAAALGRLIAGQALACVVDLSDLGSSAARRRFMAAFAEALYEANREPLHLVLDEADLWAPQRPIKGWEGLLGHIEKIVRRGRVRGFIPWLITQRPAVVHKDVLSQADILIAMKLTASQDRDAIGAWIEGQADRQEGKRILGELPRLKQGEGYLWAPGHGILQRVRFPAIRTFDSSRTPKRGERLAVPRTLADVDLTAIVAALSAAETGATDKGARRSHSGNAVAGRSCPSCSARAGAGGRESADCDARGRKPRARFPAGRNCCACTREQRGLADISAGLGTHIGDQTAALAARRRQCQVERRPAHRGPRRASSRRAKIADGIGSARAGAVYLGPGRYPRRAETQRQAFQRRAQRIARRGLRGGNRRSRNADAGRAECCR